jgi:predicted transcriptional regulator
MSLRREFFRTRRAASDTPVDHAYWFRFLNEGRGASRTGRLAACSFRRRGQTIDTRRLTAMIHTRGIKDLMSRDIMTVSDDMTTDDLARYLIDHEISGAPVVDEQGHLVGMVSMTDIGRNLAEPSEIDSSPGSDMYRDDVVDTRLEDRGERRVEDRAAMVRDVMTPAVRQVPTTASVQQVARLMVDQHIHRVVVTQGKEPVGIITSMDLLKLIADQV